MSTAGDADRDDATDNVLDDTRSLPGVDAIPAGPGDSVIGRSESEVQPQQPVLGEYVLLGKIGAGGMGQVFKAQHRRMERIVALKVLRPTTMEATDAVNRFHREVRAAAKLFHPNIVTAFDAGEQGGVHYLVMEYVHGQSLSNLVQQHGPLAPEKATNLILQAANGLEYAHSREVIHRDVKPSNLILADDGTVKILDMGLARVGKVSALVEATATGVIIGTVSYMSPEQARDAKSVDHRSDIYSLGCTFYYLLTGKPPFCGDVVETLLAHAQQPPPLLRHERRDIPERLDQILQRMLAKDPKARFQTMGELIADLEDCGLPGVIPVLRINAPGISTSDSKVALPRTGKATPKLPAVKITAVGIDLGVDSSVIAYVNEEGEPTTVANQDNEQTTSSAVKIDGMKITLGRNLLGGPAVSLDKIAFDVKRSIGKKLYPRAIDGNRYPPEVLLALVLSKLAGDGRRCIGDWKHVVLSVPDSFDEICRKSVQDAGYIAGLEVMGLVNETMAAALSFGHRMHIGEPRGNEPGEEHFFILKLGAGSFAVSVVRREDSRLSGLAIDGDAALGVRDFDDRIVSGVKKQFAAKFGVELSPDAQTTGWLRRKCAVARQQLSTEDSATISLGIQGRTLVLEISRAQFATMVGELLRRIERAAQRTLDAAQLQWRQISRVLLVGGGTRMPIVRKMIRQLAGQDTEIFGLPSEAVAHGAALYAAIQLAKSTGKQASWQVDDVAFHSLGVVGIDRTTRKPCNAILIPRNTRLPATTKRTFATQRHGQESVAVQILQGESVSPDECTPIGKCVIGNLPPNLPAGSPVTVEFHYSASGRLTVYVESSATGYRATKEISRASGLTNVDLTRWREWVETMTLCNDFL